MKDCYCYCMHCGGKIQEKDNYCEECGRNAASSKKMYKINKLKEAGKKIYKECPVCDYETFVDDQYCHNCGHDFFKKKKETITSPDLQKPVVVTKHIKYDVDYRKVAGAAALGTLASGLGLVLLKKLFKK